MTTDTLEERRRYIAEIKNSFHNPNYSSKYKDIGSMEQTDVDEKGGSFKVRALLAILLFAAFIACDRNQVTLYEKDTESVYAVINGEIFPGDSFSVETLLQSVEDFLP